MTWFYVLKGHRTGPVAAGELLQLVATRALTPGTPVWRDGLSDWQPFRDVATRDPDLAAGVPCSLCRQTLPLDQIRAVESQPVCPTCEPRAQETAREALASRLDAKALRQRHLKHETSLKSVGLLFIGSALVLGYFGVKWLLGNQQALPFRLPFGRLPKGFSLALLPVSAALLWAGVALTRLRPGIKIPAGILAFLGLFVFPLGTVICAYVLYALCSKKGSFILSAGYPQIVALTPEIRYRTSPIIWIALAALVVAVVLERLGILEFGGWPQFAPTGLRRR
jgi:hypothetical protein